MKTVWWLVEHPQNASRQTVWPRLNKKSEYMCHALKSTTCYYLINLPEFVCIHYIYIYVCFFLQLFIFSSWNHEKEKHFCTWSCQAKHPWVVSAKVIKDTAKGPTASPRSRIGEGPERKHLVPTCQTGVPCLIGSTPCCWRRGCFLGTKCIKLSVLPFTWSLDASKVFSTPFSAYFAKQQKNNSKPTKETFIKFMSFSKQQRWSKTWFTKNQPTIWCGIHLIWYGCFQKQGNTPKMDSL